MFDSNRDELLRSLSYDSMTGEYEVQARRQHFEDDDDDYYMAVGYGIRIFFYVVGSLIFLGILLCLWRCQRRRRRQGGQILSPPTQPALNTSAPYPQQMYAQPIYNAPPPVPPAPNNPYPAVVYPTYPTTGAAPYPTNTQYPVASQYQASAAPYPGAASPYPAAGAPYPAAGAPYPAAGAPYPTAGAPYSTGAPGGAPYPTPYPQPTAPSAPDANIFLGLAPPGWNAAVLPPSYDQAVNMNKTH